MSNRKKSLFPASTTVPSGSSFDFFLNGVNYQISDTNLYASLGVTGTIVPAGLATGSPVIDTQGTVNNIRTMENGPGVKSEISPLNGIKLSHNFAVDTVGAPLMLNTTALSPTFPSVVAGSGMAISEVDNHLVFAATAIAASTTTVVVLEKSDLPAPVSGVISLAAGKNYVLGNNLSIGTDRIDTSAGTISWTSNNTFGPTLTYEGTGTMFTGVDATFNIFDASLSAPNGQVFDYSNVASPGTSVFLCESVNIISCVKVGTFNNMASLVISGTGVFFDDNGITILGTAWRIWRIQNFGQISTNAAGIGIDLGSASSVAIILEFIFYTNSAGGTAISGLANNGNVPSGTVATLSSLKIGGIAASIAGITKDDIRWAFSGNSSIPDTRPDALISIVGNTTETVISASSSDGTNAVLMAGTWTVESDSHFTADTNGRITYNGERPFTGPIDFATSILMASGGDKQVKVYLCIDGTIVVASGKQGTSSSTKAASITGIWQHTFENGSYCEIWLENNVDTTNVVGAQAVGRVN